MKFRVLGCSGGIGGAHRTTSFLIDDDILLDGGTGAADLSRDELARIDHVFVTHSHLDHIACIPLLLDSVSGCRTRPVTVHALDETIAVLKAHVFNWTVWPDFTRIPTPENPQLRYEPISLGERVQVADRSFVALPANHVVPACGYLISSKSASLAFSGDTADCPAFWDRVNAASNLRYLIIETAYRNADKDIAAAAKHLTPSALAKCLSQLRGEPEVFITHLKPGEGLETMAEVRRAVARSTPRMLQKGDLLQF